MKTKFIKLTAMITAVIFLWDTVVWAAPGRKSIFVKSYNPPKDISARFTIHDSPFTSLYIPEQYGRIEKSDQTFSEQERPLVILLKDAHCHYEAQHNIAKIIGTLKRDYGVDIVALEGGTGKLDYSQYGKVKNKDVKKKVSDMFVRKGYLSGPEYLAITEYNELPVGVYGIEDTQLYVKNFISFRNTLKGFGEIKSFADALQGTISKLKEKVYGKELLAFDKKLESYQSNTMPLSEWISFLAEQFTDNKQQKNFDLIIKAIELEDEIDFNKVERERTALITGLEKSLPEEALKELVEKSLLFKLGKISSVKYYTHLEQYLQPITCNQPLINLKKYIQLVKLQDKIDSDKLFLELDWIENQIKEALFRDNRERQLDNLNYRVKILNDLLKLKLTRTELKYYDNHRDLFMPEALLSFIKIQAPLNGIGIPPLLEDSDLHAHLANLIFQGKSFYKIAIERDKVLVENTISAMERENKEKAVMVVGGFHTEGIVRELQDKNVDYIVITPTITKQENTPYLKLMLDERIKPKGTGDTLAVMKLLAWGKETENAKLLKVLGVERLAELLQDEAIMKYLKGEIKDLQELGKLEEKEEKLLRSFRDKLLKDMKKEEQGEAIQLACNILGHLIEQASPVEVQEELESAYEVEEEESPDGGARKSIVDNDATLNKKMKTALRRHANAKRKDKSLELIQTKINGEEIEYYLIEYDENDPIGKILTRRGIDAYNLPVKRGKNTRFIFINSQTKDREFAIGHELLEISWIAKLKELEESGELDLRQGFDIPRAAHILAWGQQTVEKGWSDFITQQLRNCSIAQLIRIKEEYRWAHRELRTKYLPMVGISQEQLENINRSEESVKKEAEIILGNCSGIASTENYGNDTKTRSVLREKVERIHSSEKTIILSFELKKEVADWHDILTREWQIKRGKETWTLDILSGEWVEEKTRTQKTNEEMQEYLGIKFDLELFLKICEGKDKLVFYLSHPEDCGHHLLIDKTEDKNEYALALQDNEGTIYINREIFDLNDSSLIHAIIEFLKEDLEREERGKELFTLIMLIINRVKDTYIPEKNALVKSLLSNSFHENFPEAGLLTKVQTAEIAASLYVRALDTENATQKYILHCAAESMLPKGSKEKRVISSIMEYLTETITRKALITLEEDKFTIEQMDQMRIKQEKTSIDEMIGNAGENDYGIYKLKEKLEEARAGLGSRVNIFLLDPGETTPYAFSVYWNNEKKTIDIYINNGLLNNLRINLLAGLVDPYNFDLPDRDRKAMIKRLRLKVKAYLFTLYAEGFFEGNGTSAENLDTRSMEELEGLLKENEERILKETDAESKWMLEQYYQALKAYRIAYILLDSEFYELAHDYFIIAKTLLPQKEAQNQSGVSREEIVKGIDEMIEDINRILEMYDSITFGFNPIEKGIFSRTDELIRRKARRKRETEIDPGMENAGLIASSLTLLKNGKIKSKEKASSSKAAKKKVRHIESIVWLFYKNRKAIKQHFGIEYGDLRQVLQYFDLITFKGKNGLAKIEMRGEALQQIFINEELLPKKGDSAEIKKVKKDTLFFVLFCLLYRYKHPNEASGGFINGAEKVFLASFPNSEKVVKLLNAINGKRWGKNELKLPAKEKVDTDLNGIHKKGLKSSLRWLINKIPRWRKIIIVISIISIIAIGIIALVGSKSDQTPTKQQIVTTMYLDGGDLHRKHDTNFYDEGQRVTEVVSGETISIDKDLLYLFWETLGLDGHPNINGLVNKLLEKTPYDKNNLKKKAELVKLLQDYVYLAQSRETNGQIPVVLMVGGAKNYDVATGTGTDLVEFILAADYIKKSLLDEGLKLKVVPFYDIDSKQNPSNKGLEGHIRYIEEVPYHVNTSYPTSGGSWQFKTRRFVSRHEKDMPKDRLLLASVIDLLLQTDADDIIHFIYVGHGHKYTEEELKEQKLSYHRLWTPIFGYKKGIDFKLRKPSQHKRQKRTADMGCSSTYGGITYPEISRDTKTFIADFHEASQSDNMGKDIAFIVIDDNTIEINGQKIDDIEHVTLAEERLEKIISLAQTLNLVKAHPEFISQLWNLLQYGKIKIYKGTDKTRAAGAFGHMENGVLYIDELLFEDNMAIIHEAIHAFLVKGATNEDIESFVENIDDEYIKMKIKQKTDEASSDKPETYYAYLRHYYARYYLQIRQRGDCPESENNVLTDKIKRIRRHHSEKVAKGENESVAESSAVTTTGNAKFYQIEHGGAQTNVWVFSDLVLKIVKEIIVFSDEGFLYEWSAELLEMFYQKAKERLGDLLVPFVITPEKHIIQERVHTFAEEYLEGLSEKYKRDTTNKSVMKEIGRFTEKYIQLLKQVSERGVVSAGDITKIDSLAISLKDEGDYELKIADAGFLYDYNDQTLLKNLKKREMALRCLFNYRDMLERLFDVEIANDFVKSLGFETIAIDEDGVERYYFKGVSGIHFDQKSGRTRYDSEADPDFYYTWINIVFPPGKVKASPFNEESILNAESYVEIKQYIRALADDKPEETRDGSIGTPQSAIKPDATEVLEGQQTEGQGSAHPDNGSAESDWSRQLAKLLKLDKIELEEILQKEPTELLHALYLLLKGTTEDKLKIILESAEKVTGAFNVLEKLGIKLPDEIQENIDQAQELLAISIAADRLRELLKKEDEERMPMFMKKLKNKLEELAPQAGFDPDMVSGLIEELYRADGDYLELVIEGIKVLFGIDEDIKEIEECFTELRKYKSLLAQLKDKFSVSETETPGNADEIHNLLIRYMEQRDKSSLCVIAELIARHLVDEDKEIHSLFENEDESIRKSIIKGLNRIISLNGLEKDLNLLSAPKSSLSRDLEEIRSVIKYIIGLIRDTNTPFYLENGETAVYGGPVRFNNEGAIDTLSDDIGKIKDSKEAAELLSYLGRKYTLLLKENAEKSLIALYILKKAEELLDKEFKTEELQWEDNIPLVAEARALIGAVTDNQNNTYTIEPRGEGAVWLLREMAKKEKLEILYDGTEEEKEATKAWLLLHGIIVPDERFVTKYPKQYKTAVGLLSGDTADIPEGHRVIRCTEETDMALASRAAAILGSQEVLEMDYLIEKLKQLYSAYFLSDDEIEEWVQKVILKGGAIIIDLPPMRPFIRAFYNTLEITKEIVAKAV